MNGVLIAALALVHRPLGDYMARVYSGTKHSRVERAVGGSRVARTRGRKPGRERGPTLPEDVRVRLCAGEIQGRVELRVIDQGPGVPDAVKESMFQPFQRLGDAPKGAGVGLGLAVARGLSEALDGSVWAEDTPGGGLTVVVSLPAAPAAKAHTTGGETGARHRRHRRARGACVTRVLVVDDEAALVRALAINLKARRYEVDVAVDGRTALDLAARKRPDVVLLDLGLPDMDGVDVIAGLRGWTDVPIIVLSARELSDDKVEALDAGADDFVTKPFGMDELLARLRAAIRRGAAPTSRTRPWS